MGGGGGHGCLSLLLRGSEADVVSHCAKERVEMHSCLRVVARSESARQ